MAIDTRDKRASSLLIGLPFGRVYPVPDGTITETDFEQESRLYAGIASAPPVPIVPPTWPTIFDIALAAEFSAVDDPDRPPFVDGSIDAATVGRTAQRAADGRPTRPPYAPGVRFR